MKIGPSTDVVKIESSPTVPGPGQAGVSGNAPVSPVEQADRVELSAAANAADGLAAETPVSEQKVAEIRRAIESGEFRVNPAEIADKMISEAASLLETIARQDLAISTDQNREDPMVTPKADKRG
ncbi:MAG: flagellar biosynthesis anti-sigma factor FlgM [Burkholderiaceae bacterium]